MEPEDLWSGRYMAPSYRDQGPVRSLDDGRLYYQDGSPFECQMAINSRIGKPSDVWTERAERGGTDPNARIEDLDLDGIDAAVLYPTVGLAHGHVEDPGLAAAMARAYNTWLAEWTSSHSDRLFGAAMLPVQSVLHAVDELRFARESLGFHAAFLRPHIYKGRTIHDPEWDPLWGLAEELDCPIALHGGGAWPFPQAGADRFVGDKRGSEHVVVHPFEQQLACVGLIQAGVFDRFPKLRVAFLESGGGWIVPLLERLERHYDQDVWAKSERTDLRPWEYFRRNCWISFEPIEQSLGLVADYIGPNNILWATDYPHLDGFFPGAPKMVEQCLEGCSEATRLAVLGGGARAFYAL